MPFAPRAAPTTQVQIIFASEPAAKATTPATIHAIVPTETKATIVEILERSGLFISVNHPIHLAPSLLAP